MQLLIILASVTWHLTTAIFSILTLIITCILATAIYRLFLHPLSSIPGPRLAAVSNVWYAYHARNGRIAKLGETLHQRYGPMVRVGPDEVWMNSKAAFKAIYSTGSGFEKSDFYLSTALSRPRLEWLLEARSTDSLDLLSERDMKRYRSQRRLIGPIYRLENVIKYETAVDSVLVRVIDKLRALDGANLDLKEWMHMIVVECLGAVVLSWSPGMLEQGTDWNTSVHSYQSWRRKSVLGLFPLVAKLELCHKSIGRAFSLVWGVTFKTPVNFRPFFVDASRRISRRLKAARRVVKEIREDLTADLIRLHQERPEFTEMYLRKMIMTNFGAGHETMASTLTSLMATIGSNSDVQARLVEEVQSFPDTHLFSSSVRMPYMQAVIKESKRLHPVIAMSLPRRVPNSGLQLHGTFFPAGMTVGCSPIALHRNEDICGPEPDNFDPERWVDEVRAREMDVYSLGWGGGARSCPGRHLAEMIVWKVIATVFRHFDVEVDVPEGCKMPTYFLSMMTGVKVRFIPRVLEGCESKK